MTRAAPVRLRYALVRPPGGAALGLLAVALLGAALWLAWAWLGAGARPWPALLGALLWLAVCVGAWRCWRDWPQGQLEWDGGQWWLHGGLAARPMPLQGAPQVYWDGQGFFLLSVAGIAGRRRWLWLQRASAPAAWGDLRRAVYWRARATAPA